MVENAANIVAIEVLAAAQGIDVHAPLRSSPVLEGAKARLRQKVPPLEHDRFLAPDIAAACLLVRDGTLAEVAADDLGAVRFGEALR
jgi:histidine ammonia-lyase